MTMTSAEVQNHWSLVRAYAEDERQTMLQQALREHEERIQTEMRRYRQEIANIQRTYELRLSKLT